jgi:hypothetical protein
MSEAKPSGTESRKPSASEPRGGREATTPGVHVARNAVSDTMVAVGDVLGATVHTAADLGEDVVHGVGRVARTAVDETANVLAGISGGLRGIVNAGMSGRSRDSKTGT